LTIQQRLSFNPPEQVSREKLFDSTSGSRAAKSSNNSAIPEPVEAAVQELVQDWIC
jgi:hypothetical protein